jgi:hypothetical protein
MIPLLAASLPAQSTQKAQPEQEVTKDVDPLSLDVLRAVAQPVEQAQTFSFRALVGEEELATNGQIITLFHTIDVTVQRPDKIHMIFRGRGQRVDFYGENGTLTRYSPDVKLYTITPAKSTIDATIADLNAKDVDFPVGPFIRSDFYDIAAKAIITGYVIGRVKVYDQDVHQLAFTAKDADWQLWVTGGEKPRFVRAEIVNKDLEGKPRTDIQFLDWNLNPTIAADEFTFTKPADAVEISVMPEMGGK